MTLRLLRFTTLQGPVEVTVRDCVVAGWTGRDKAALAMIRHADRFAMRLSDPESGAAVEHAYAIETLPVVS